MNFSQLNKKIDIICLKAPFKVETSSNATFYTTFQIQKERHKHVSYNTSKFFPKALNRDSWSPQKEKRYLLSLHGCTPRWTPIQTCLTCSLSQKCRAERAVLEMHILGTRQKLVHPSLPLECEWESQDSCFFLELPGAGGKRAFWEHIPRVQRRGEGWSVRGCSRPRQTLHSEYAKCWSGSWS